MLSWNVEARIELARRDPIDGDIHQGVVACSVTLEIRRIEGSKAWRLGHEDRSLPDVRPARGKVVNIITL